MESAFDLDDILEEVGGWRRWHIAIFFILGLGQNLPYCSTGLIIVFTGWEPPHHCKIPEGHVLNESIPVDKHGYKGQYSKCKMYTNYTDHNSTTDCQDGWYYESSGYETLVTEFDLVCDKDFYVDMGQSIHSLGPLIATVFTAYLTDRFGRKKMHIFGIFMCGCMGCLLAFSTSYIMFVTVRTISAVFAHISGSAAMVLLMELYSAKRRSFIGIGYEIFWVEAYMITLLLGYFITSWRVLQFTFSCLNFLFVIIYPCFLTESVSWLVSKGKYAEAEVTLKRIAQLNNVPVRESYLNKSYQRLSCDDVEIYQDEPDTDTSVQNKNELNNLADQDNEIIESNTHNTQAQEVKQNEMCSDSEGSTVLFDKFVIPLRERISNGYSKLNSGFDSTNDETAIDSNNSDVAVKDTEELQTMNKDGEFELSSEERSETVDSNVKCGNKSDRKDFEKGVPISQLFCDPKLRLHIIISFIIWFANSLIYGGLTLASPTFGPNRFLTFAVLGAIEIPVYILTVPIVARYGRRIPLMLFFFITGLPLGLLALVPSDNHAVAVTLVVIGKFGVTGAFAVMLLYINELFPTNIRTTGFAISGIGGNFGGQLAPFAAYLEKQVPWIPNMLFGIVAIIAGILVLALPETVNKPLALTTDDIHVVLYGKKRIVNEDK